MAQSVKELREAVCNFNIAKVQELLERGVDCNEKDINGDTPLLIASRANAVKIACLLIDENAMVHETDRKGNTALIYAAGFGSAMLVRSIMSYGGNIKAKNNAGETAYDCAVKYGHFQVALLVADTEEQRQAARDAESGKTRQAKIANKQQALKVLARRQQFKL